MAQETGLPPRRFNITNPRTGRTMTVATVDGPPTEEEAIQLLGEVYGEGMYTKQDLPSLYAVPSSLAATKALGLGLKSIPGISALTGAAGAAGEIHKQLQVPSTVGRFTITNIQEPAWFGTTTREYDPRSMLDRSKMVALKGLDEAGMELGGAAAMKLLERPMQGVAGMLQKMGMGSDAGTKIRLDAQAAGAPDLAGESLRAGLGPRSSRPGGRYVAGRGAEEIKRSADIVDDLLDRTGASRLPLVDMEMRGSGPSFLSDVLRQPGPNRMGSLLEHIQAMADIKGGGTTSNLENMTSELGPIWQRYMSDDAFIKALKDEDKARRAAGAATIDARYTKKAVGETPISDDYVRQERAAPTPGSGQRLIQDSDDIVGSTPLQPGLPVTTDASGTPLRTVGRTDPNLPSSASTADVDAINLPGGQGRVLAPRDPTKSFKEPISLVEALQDKRRLEQVILPSLYEKLARTGTTAQADEFSQLVKGIRDVLDERIHSTLQLAEDSGKLKRGTRAIFQEQNERTQQLNRLLEYVKESPGDTHNPFSYFMPRVESFAARGIDKAQRASRYASPQNIVRGASIAQEEGMPEPIVPGSASIFRSLNQPLVSQAGFGARGPMLRPFPDR